MSTRTTPRSLDRAVLIREAEAIIDLADAQRRDLNDYECGRLDAILDVVSREPGTLRTRDMRAR